MFRKFLSREGDSETTVYASVEKRPMAYIDPLGLAPPCVIARNRIMSCSYTILSHQFRQSSEPLSSKTTGQMKVAVPFSLCSYS